MELLLINPRDIKKSPGRKSDVSDAQWIAQLLACGLLTGSFVPERPQRELRDLTRHRAQLVCGNHAGSQPDSQDAGRRQHQVGGRRFGHPRRFGTEHAAGAYRRKAATRRNGGNSPRGA